MTLLNLSKYKSVSSGSNIKLPKALDHPKKGLINIQNVNDNECFKWCLVWYLHPADHHSTKLRRAEKYFAREFDFKNIKFAIKIADTHKNKNKKKKKNCISNIIFGHENKERYPSYVSKNTVKRLLDLLLIREEGYRHYVLIPKDVLVGSAKGIPTK